MPTGTSGSVLVVIVGPPSPVGTGPTLPTTAGQRHAGLPKAHKVSGGYVVEKQSLVQTKQSSLALGQGGFNDNSLGRQAIQGCGRAHLRPGVGNQPARYPTTRWSESNRVWPIRWPGESVG